MKGVRIGVVRIAYCVAFRLPTHYALYTILFTGILLVAFTAVAHAHAELLIATPTPGSMVSNPIGQIRLTFSESLVSDSEIILFGDNFQPVSGIVAQPDGADPTAIVAAVPELAAGMYTVQWTAVSSDGHATTGSYAFRVSATNLAITPHMLWLSGLSLLFISAIVLLWRKSRNPSSLIRNRGTD